MHHPSNFALLGPTRALIEGIIDYAGMFPPARLPLHDALVNYLQYRSHELSWMLGRFICPNSSLSQMIELLRTEPPTVQIPISLISPVPVSEPLAVEKLLVESASLDAKEFVLIDSMEIKLGCEPDSTRADFDSVLSAFNGVVETTENDLQIIYIEVPWVDTFRLQEFAESLASVVNLNGVRFAAKIRTGGIEAHQFPAIKDVARFISVCNSANVAFKATAGLHHPFRHFSKDVETDMHGFVNVFFGAAAKNIQDVGTSVLMDILSDKDPAAFTFRRDSISWKHITLSAIELERSRSSFATGFGSCSFDEPVTDLKSLTLLP